MSNPLHTIELNGIQVQVLASGHPSTVAFAFDRAQRLYPEPHPLGPTLSHVMRNTSISEEESSTFLRFFGRHLQWAPLSSWVPAALASCGFANDARFFVSTSTTNDPLTDGFLEYLVFLPSHDARQSVDAVTLIEAFVAHEIGRFDGGENASMESYIAKVYRGYPREKYSRVMSYVDLPSFDNGTLELGFGLLIRRDGTTVRLWIWSRPVFYHK
jgi:hypothetical protein